MKLETLDPEERKLVLRRDGSCFLFKLDQSHECRDRWGTPHGPNVLGILTVDHFHWEVGGAKGKRAPHRREHLTAMCWTGNVGVPSADVREAQRSYARLMYPGHDCERDDA